MLDWTKIITSNTAVIVPTRSLADILKLEILKQYQAQGTQVFASPQILTWADFVKELYLHNQFDFLADQYIEKIITPQQADILWGQVISASKYADDDLVLLNVSQTAKAVQNSWRLVHDWECDLAQCEQYHSSELNQLLIWFEQYQNKLSQHKAVDQYTLVKMLLQTKNLLWPFKKLIWYSYDLISDAQHRLCQLAKKNGVIVEEKQLIKTPKKQTFYCFSNEKQEFSYLLHMAKASLEEQADTRINIVVPALDKKLPLLESLCKDIFYPDISPLDLSKIKQVYRFSLGKSLSEWPAVNVALKVLDILRNPLDISILNGLFESEYLPFKTKYWGECEQLIRYLMRYRLHAFSVDDLFVFSQKAHKNEQGQSHESLHAQQQFQECLQKIAKEQDNIQKELIESKVQTHYAVLPLKRWATLFEQWLSLFGWRIEDEDNSSVGYQLEMRWQALWVEFNDLSVVQPQLGLNRALDLFTRLAQETVFQPQADDVPIIISGMYETIGRDVDICCLTGMDEHYPTALSGDAFIPTSMLQHSRIPTKSLAEHLAQSKKVVNSIMQTASTVMVSYSQFDDEQHEVAKQCSSFFKNDFFNNDAEGIKLECLGDQFSVCGKTQAELLSALEHSKVSECVYPLESYRDTHGGSVSKDEPIKGGASIVTNQSRCPFKAYLTHRLGFDEIEQYYFGFDHLDKGNIIHLVMENAWKTLVCKDALLQLSVDGMETFCEKIVHDSIMQHQSQLSKDKQALLAIEKERLKELLLESLQLDLNRLDHFSIQELEQKRQAHFGGIQFNYVIDRLDKTEDGRYILIDYKTGQVSKRDWLGERIKNPQLPLYFVILQQQEKLDFAGMAYFKIRKGDVKYESLSTENTLMSQRNKDKQEVIWEQQQEQWKKTIPALIESFKLGEASVDPIDKETCSQCGLSSVCRIYQLQISKALLNYESL